VLTESKAEHLCWKTFPEQMPWGRLPLCSDPSRDKGRISAVTASGVRCTQGSVTYFDTFVGSWRFPDEKRAVDICTAVKRNHATGKASQSICAIKTAYI